MQEDNLSSVFEACWVSFWEAGEEGSGCALHFRYSFTRTSLKECLFRSERLGGNLSNFLLLVLNVVIFFALDSLAPAE